jgi:putative spermidine/putrescine transport system permease protein
MLRETRPFSYAILTAVFVLFVLFLYAPTFAITTLSFQGPQGGLVFPMRGLSLH